MTNENKKKDHPFVEKSIIKKLQIVILSKKYSV